MVLWRKRSKDRSYGAILEQRLELPLELDSQPILGSDFERSIPLRVVEYSPHIIPGSYEPAHFRLALLPNRTMKVADIIHEALSYVHDQLPPSRIIKMLPLYRLYAGPSHIPLRRSRRIETAKLDSDAFVGYKVYDGCTLF